MSRDRGVYDYVYESIFDVYQLVIYSCKEVFNVLMIKEKYHWETQLDLIGEMHLGGYLIYTRNRGGLT